MTFRIFHHSSSLTPPLFTDLDPSLDYDFELKFNPTCLNTDSTTQPVMFKLTLLSDSLLSYLSPYSLNHRFIKKQFSMWPLTNNIHMLDNSRVLVSSLNSFILRCKRDEVSLKDLAPPVLHWFIPPVLANYDYTDGTQTLKLMKDVKLDDYIRNEENAFRLDEPWSMVLEFNRGDIMIEPSEATLEINVSWKGLRYYLYHYRLISYVLGVSVLWGISSFTLFATIGGLIIIREISVEKELEKIDDDEDEKRNNDLVATRDATMKEPIILKGDFNQGYEGSTDNVKFRVDVTND
ncbi:hypothetical protein BON22_2967 [Cyberlindnera fabianii]|uniref:Seipin n=1 Tax=Cyberlindnera fabianii TaxID=36022 RepID=A0A1V2L504_CYBFA|nr:hypothetical protein BON22_2967 [Cyberlindnera fabianii]